MLATGCCHGEDKRTADVVVWQLLLLLMLLWPSRIPLMPMESGGKLFGDSRGLLLLAAEELLEGRLSSASAENGEILAAAAAELLTAASVRLRGVELRRPADAAAEDKSRLPASPLLLGVRRAASSCTIRDDG